VLRARLALCLALLWPSALWPAAAVAQPIDAAGAETLRHDLQSWFDGMLGPNLGAAEERLRVSPEGDHYRIALPFADAAGENAITADARPLPDGRWSVDPLRLPAATRFTLHMPEPGAPPGPAVPTQFDMRIGDQHAHALVDPALAAPSQLSVELASVDLETDSAHRHQLQHLDRYTMQATLQPDRGRLDLLENSTIAGWRSAAREGEKPAVGFGADRILANLRVDGIDRGHAAALTSALSGLIATLPPAAAAQHEDMALSAPTRAALRALIESLRDIVTDVQGDESIDGVHVAVAGVGEFTVRHVSLGMAGAAPDGMLHATMNIGLDGLMAHDAPPSAMGLMPHHLTLQPSVSGVSLQALTTLALAATDQNASRAQLQADTAALWAQGGVTVGLDAIDMDVGPAALHGHGSVQMTGPGDYTAHARITATGVDDLLQQAAGNPDLQRVFPLIAMVRGFARPEGDHLVWDVVASPAGLTVNGVPIGPGRDRPDRHNPDRHNPDRHQPDRR
jgi:hypothetical protein